MSCKIEKKKVDRKSRCCLDTDSATVFADTRQLSSEELPGVLKSRKITEVKFAEYYEIKMTRNAERSVCLHSLAICLQYIEQTVSEYLPVGEGSALVIHLSALQTAVCQ